MHESLPRHFNVARARIGDLLGCLMVFCVCGLFAGTFIFLILDSFEKDDDGTWIWAVALFLGPIAFALCYAALSAVVFFFRRIAQLRKSVDLDAPEIVIRRRPKHRLAMTAGQWIFIPIMPIFFLRSIDFEEAPVSALVSIVFCLLFLASTGMGIWRTWRRPAKTYSPIVLGADGFLDRSTDRPRIPWRDIANSTRVGAR
jgi:MFS family permease